MSQQFRYLVALGLIVLCGLSVSSAQTTVLPSPPNGAPLPILFSGTIEDAGGDSGSDPVKLSQGRVWAIVKADEQCYRVTFDLSVRTAAVSAADCP